MSRNVDLGLRQSAWSSHAKAKVVTGSSLESVWYYVEHRSSGIGKAKPPVTPAVRALRAAGVAFTDHLYDYEDKGGTAVPARELDVDEHSVVKTLVMEDDRQQPLIVLMHGDMMAAAGGRCFGEPVYGQ